MNPILPNTTPRLICTFCAAGLKNVIPGLTDTQCVVSDTPDDFDPSWFDYPKVLVAPGAAMPDEGGHGGQEGGTLNRRQEIIFSVFYRSKLDRHNQTEIALTTPSTGMMDFVEQIRAAFKQTQLGPASGNPAQSLLYEVMRWERETRVTWVDEELTILNQQISYSAAYYEVLPNAITLTREQIGM